MALQEENMRVIWKSTQKASATEKEERERK